MANRFTCREITIKHCSRRGRVLSSRKSYGIYDRCWEKFTRQCDNDPVKYVPFSEYASKAFAQAVAKYLNENTPSDRPTRLVDGFDAAIAAAAAWDGLEPRRD